MKKTLTIVLALVFVLSIAGTAFAASNPFVDVPAKHWAYDAVSKLAKAGIIDGMGDGTFQGDKTMTRYEMAQIVAKAMARSDKADAANKALIDKLAVEFAKELNNLGVRVAKLENKTNIGLNYESRIRYSGDSEKTLTGTNQFDWRQRIILGGAVNDNVTYGARLEASRVFGGGSAAVAFNQAYFNVKDFFGAVDQLTIGKLSTSGITNGLLNGSDANNDGFLITKKLGPDLTLKYAYVTNPLVPTAACDITLVNLDFAFTPNFKVNIGHQVTQAPAVPWHPLSWDVGFQSKMGDLTLTGEYVSTKFHVSHVDGKAFAIQLTNGISGYFAPVADSVNPKKAHTNAFALGYVSIDPAGLGYSDPANTSAFRGWFSSYSFVKDTDDVKGFFFRYQNVVSKNVVWTAEYMDMKQKTWTGKDSAYATHFQFYF